MKRFSKRVLARIIGVFSLTALLASTLIPTFQATAALTAGDYFQITAAGNATTMNAGTSLQFTLISKDASNVQNPLTGSDYAIMEIVDPTTLMASTNAVFTALGDGLVIKASQNPGGNKVTAADINPGTANRNFVAVNIADGAAVGNTFTVSAVGTFKVFVWAPGSSPPPSGTSEWQVTVSDNLGSGADHLLIYPGGDGAEVNGSVNFSVKQANAGGGTVTTALIDAGVSVNNSATITAVGGVPLETPATSISNQILTSGALAITVKCGATGAVTITPSSATLLGADTPGTLTCAAATTFGIQGYGPMNGGTGMPTSAPVDFMFNKDPSLYGTFPMTNTASSTFSIVNTSTGVAVTGIWNRFSEIWGDTTSYRISFSSSSPLTASTSYTASVKKTFVSSTNLGGGMPALTSGELAYSFAFTTGTGGGDYTPGGGFTGTMGGAFPPTASLGYPKPGEGNVPTNAACIMVGFDRDMDPNTLTTNNIYLKNIVNNAEVAISGTPAITVGSESKDVCIFGYTLPANSEIRVVVTRDVRDPIGTQLAGMPCDASGNITNGFGFGYGTMCSFKESFHTGTGASTVTAALMGSNLDKFKSAGVITGVPVGSIMRFSYNNPLNGSTVNTTNVTLKKNGSIPTLGTVFYDAAGNAIEFTPTSVLSANTSYTFAASTSVTSISGTAISALSQTFTTGAADSTSPTVAFAEADNFGFRVQSDEPLLLATAINKNFYTFKTCIGQGVNADGVKCVDNLTDPTSVGLTSGVNAHYEPDKNSVWMEGLTLTAGAGFYVSLSASVTDIAGNGVNAASRSWTGFVMDSGKFEGGQGMFQMDNVGFEDKIMGGTEGMGMKPVNAMPMNTMAGATTKYFINIPLATAIPSGGYIELTFPEGFVTTSAKRDAQSPMNSDFNGPNTGTVTFNTTIPTGFTDGAGAQANDGVGYITAARKVAIKLSAATQANDFLHIDLDGITNSTLAKSFDTSGYTVAIKTFNTSNAMLEALNTMPFFISSAGTGSVAGQVKVDATGLNGVKVFLGSPMTGPMEVTTSADGAGTLVAGSNDGEYKFENLPSGQYFVFTEPMFTVSATDYYGNSMPEPLSVSGATTKNISVSAATSTGKATQPISITFPSLASVSSLGFSDSIDIFAFNPSSRIPVIKTVSRTTLGTSPYSVNLFLPSVGDWNIGIGPAMPKGPMSGGMGTMGGWMPPPNVSVSVAAADLGGAAKSAITLAMSVSDKTITGKVLDGTGAAVANAEVYAYDPQAGKNAHATAGTDGSFSLSVTNGSYKVGAFLPGLPNSQETPVLVSGSSFYVNGSTTASTGSSAGNPFNLKITVPAYTIQGRVATSGGSAIAGAAIWAHRTDAPSPPLRAVTDSSGNYTLYIAAGTWQVEGDAPNYGYLGAKTLTVTTTSLTSQDFEVASDLNTVSGTINTSNTDDSGTMVYAYGVNGSAEAKTDTSGNYTLNLPDGTYDIGAVVPGVGELTPLEDVVVDGTETGQDITPATFRTLTVTLSAATTEDTTVDFFGTNGKGNELLIPAGSTSGTITVPQGTYYMDADVPGANFEDLTITGGEFNNPNGTPSALDQVNFDGAGEGATADNITITLPTIYTITGQVTSSSSGVNDVYVSAYDQSTKEYFGATTANNAAGGGLDGEYSIKLQAGTYTISADKAGYSTTPVDKIVSANSSGNNFALTASSRTITGTVAVSSVPIANAPVWAEKTGGGFVATETSTDGTYTLNVDPGIWTVNATAEGYSEGTALNVNVTAASATSKSFSVTALTGGNVLQNPQTESITPSSGGTVIDEGTNAAVVAPPNALGTSTDSGQLSIGETNAITDTPTANPIGNGYEISATDADGNPVTTLDDDVMVSFQLTLAELTAEGVDTPAEAATITNGYWDDTAGNWISLPTDCIYYNAAGTVLPENTVAGSATLLAANVSYMEFLSQTDHFTTFAPVIPTGATPPATPATPTATAGDGQVTLSWTKNSEVDMDYYNIWEANVTEGILTTLTQAACTVTPCTKVIQSLTNGTAYSFQILAVDTDGNSSAGSTAASATPVAATVTPGGGGTILNSGSSSKKTTTETDEDDETTDEEATDESADEATGEGEPGVSGANLGAGAGASGPTPFADIVGHWAELYIDELYSKSVMSGASEDKFEPDSYVSRAEISKIVVITFGLETLDSISIDTNPFKDVSKDLWYATFVKAASDGGLMEGYNDDNFKPDRKITRAEALKVFLIGALGADGIEDKIATEYDAEFGDVDAGEWYAPYVNYAAEKGIVNGYIDGTFGPDAYLTRAEVAKIASKVLGSELSAEIIGMIMGIL